MTLRAQSQRGLASAVVIIVIILAVIAMVLGRGTFKGEELGLDQRGITDVRMKRVVEALVAYASLNRRLPCPARGDDGNMSGTPDEIGRANPETATTAGSPCATADGVVPWKTLGLAREVALDGWNRQVSYRVFSPAGNTGLTHDGAANMTNCNASLGAPIDPTLDTGLLCRSGAPPATPPPNTPGQYLAARGSMLVVEDSGTTRNGNAFVLISHGVSGYGAYPGNGATARMLAGNLNPAGREFTNAQAAGTYWILPNSVAGTDPGTAAHFDDMVVYMSATELATRSKLAARSWSDIPLSATFSAPAVAAAAPGLSGENTNQTSLSMGGFFVTATNSSGLPVNLGIRTEDTITGIGVAGDGAGDLNSSSNERLRFQLGSGSEFQKMDIALNRFRVVQTVPTRLEERAEVSFWRGGDMLQTSVVTSWVEAIAPARCLYSLVSSAVFDRVDVRPIPRTGDGGQTTFSVAEIKACSEATAVCTTAVPGAQGCPSRPPSAASTSAQSIAANTANLNGFAHDNGTATTVTFDYGTTCAYPSSIAASPGSLAAGAGNTAVTASLTGLACNTSYYFRTKAVSAGGTTTGNDAIFTTASCGTPTPIASTGLPSSVTTTTATFNGSVDGNGSNTTVTFDYGTTICYGLSTSASPGSVSGGTGATPVNASLTGLACNTRYHYRVRAENVSGTTTTSDQAFTTAPCP